PIVTITRPTTASAEVKTWDVVSGADALVARYRLDDGAFGPWTKATELGAIDTTAGETLEVEVKDEEGNVATVRQALRGRADPTLAAAGSDCGCSAPGVSSRGDVIALALGLAALALVVLRRRGAGGAARATARGGFAL